MNTTRNHYQVLTRTGYVGRYSTSDEMEATQPKAFGCTWPTLAEAQTVARHYGEDAVVVDKAGDEVYDA